MLSARCLAVEALSKSMEVLCPGSISKKTCTNILYSH